MTRTKDHNIDMYNQILQNKMQVKYTIEIVMIILRMTKNILKGISPRNSIIELFHNFCY